jgi:hypothetical protein
MIAKGVFRFEDQSHPTSFPKKLFNLLELFETSDRLIVDYETDIKWTKEPFTILSTLKENLFHFVQSSFASANQQYISINKSSTKNKILRSRRSSTSASN